MEVSALKHAGVAGIHGRSPLLRLQTDERLIALIRRGNHHAFEALVARYQARLLAFCRHMLASREDAEDVLQEVFAAAFNAIQADERALNVRPWLYRIARNRSLNHLRRKTAVGVDSMDVHFAEGGLTTADHVHEREEFRLLLGDVQELPETQKTALLLREIDALSYDQIADAMETTVPSVKSLLVRARVSLAEASEARALTCGEVRDELGEVSEGLRKLSAPARRHVRTCERCTGFKKQLRQTNKALAAVFPVGPFILLKKLMVTQAGASTAASGAGAAGGVSASAATAAGTAAVGGAAGGLLSGAASAIATKAAAGLAAAAIVSVGALEVRRADDLPKAETAPIVASVVEPSVATGGTIAAPKPTPIVKKVTHKPAVKVAKAKPPVTTTTTAETPPPPATAPATTTPAQPPPTTTTQTVIDVTRLPTTPTTTDSETAASAPAGETGPASSTTTTTTPTPAPPAGEGGAPPTATTPAPPPPAPDATTPPDAPAP